MVVALLVAFALFGQTVGRRLIVINTSPSVAPGLYLRSRDPPRAGQIVDFRIPPAARPYVRARTGNDGRDWYIIKPIVAGPGDRVDTMGEWLLINDRRIGRMPPASESEGPALPLWRGARPLGADEFFVFSDRIPNSFDSRCYGPIRRGWIDAVRRPLLTW